MTTGNTRGTIPAEGGAAVTPNNSTDLTVTARSLYIGGSGNLKVDTADGSTITFSSVPVGIFPVRVKRVYATGTTATSIVALY